MSSKTVKKTTTSSTTQHKASTPTKVTKTMQQSSSRASASFSSTPSRVRTPSPARLTRMQEKDELIDLNDRLAKYIDRVRYLETENNRLTIRIQESEEVVTREVSGIKGLYESELAEARRLLDITSKENARLKLELKTSRGDHDDCKTRCAHKDRDLKDAEKTHKNLENKITELQIALNEAENRQAPLEKELSNLKNEYATLRAQLSTAKKQLEDETMMRIELANRVQTYKEDLDLSRQVHEQELNETRCRLSTTYEEIDGRVQEEYETKLQEALFEMRQEQEQHVQLAKDDIVVMYEAKLRDLDSQAQMSCDSAARSRAELKITLKKSEDSTVELTTLKQKISMLELRVRELDDAVSRERTEREIQVCVKDDEIARLKQLTHDQMLEYTDLMDVKLKLDMEIAAYRKLLEGEEARLNMSSGSDSSFQHTEGRGQKRKRASLFTQSTVNREHSRAGSSQDVVEIEAVEVENGDYIRLYNKGGEEFSLGGWQLKHVAGDLETTFKFHRTAVIKGGSHVTVYPSTSTVTHAPPSDLVMKGQKWFVGDDMHTYLINAQGKERAELHLTRSALSTTQSYRYGQELEGEKKESCSVM